MPKESEITYAFLDASNLFYGGEKILGWKIDYQKLLKYLRSKYRITKVFYYAGLDIGKYKPLSKNIDLDNLIRHFRDQLKKRDLREAEIVLIDKYIQRTKFYKKLAEFGYKLRIKPVKIFGNGDNTTKKANCDVDLTFDLMRYMSQYQKVVILSGDGDFVPVLEYLKKKKKKVVIMARGDRTAREMKQLAGGEFNDFLSLRDYLEYTPKIS